MNEIFKVIDDIDWTNLDHAYGSAADVSAQLKTLFDPNKEAEAENALNGFFANIYHQGTIYSATAHAVPFLLEAFNYCSASLKPTLLHLIMCISNGGGYHSLDDPMWQEGGCMYEGEAARKKFEENVREEQYWVEQCILKVWEGWDEYTLLLKDKNPEIASNASLILVSLLNNYFTPSNIDKAVLAEEVFSLFSNQLAEETNTNKQADLLIAIFHLKVPKEKKLELFKYYVKEDVPIVQIAAAYSILLFEKDETAIATVSKAAEDTEMIDELFAPSPWFEMRFSYYLLDILCGLPITYFDQLWPVFEKFIKGSFRFGAEFTVSPIIKMVFEKQKINELNMPINSAQKKVLQCILDTPALWDETDGNTNGEFRKWGLERDKVFVRKLIG